MCELSVISYQEEASLPPVEGSRWRAVADLFHVRLMRCFWVVLAVAVATLSSCDDVTSRYPTLDDARNDQLFERGWLPDILPPSAHDIRVTNDLDGNRSEGEFSFDPADFLSFVAQFESLYPPFEYSAGGYTWVFFCDSMSGHCYYSMR